MQLDHHFARFVVKLLCDGQLVQVSVTLCRPRLLFIPRYYGEVRILISSNRLVLKPPPPSLATLTVLANLWATVGNLRHNCFLCNFWVGVT